MKEEHWDRFYAQEATAFWQIPDSMLDHLLSGFPKTVQILDVGSGDGTLVKRLLDRGYKADGCDISLAAIELAERKTGSKRFFKLDIEKEEIEARDLIFMSLVFMFVTEKKQVLLKIRESCDSLVLTISMRFVGMKHKDYLSALNTLFVRCGFSVKNIFHPTKEIVVFFLT